MSEPWKVSDAAGRRPLRVAVIGGGIGGLCLAHGLRRAGVDVTVYERTVVRDDWLQGYRIHINPAGSRALQSCLPTALWQEFLATAGTPAAGFGFFTEHLDELLYLPNELISGGRDDPTQTHHSVSRISLRQVLLRGLDDVVQFGKTFQQYEQHPDATVTAHFTDGTSANCDVLVAADGANSAVRRQYLPDARRIDTGVVAVAGKLPLTEQTTSWLPERLRTSVSNIMPANDGALFVAVWEGDRRTAATPSLDPSTTAPGGLLLDNTQDYLFWAYAAGRDRYPTDVLAGGDGAALQHTVATAIAGWHPALSRMVTASHPTTVAPVVVRSMAPVPAWTTTNVTLIGDAIHNMTPMAGIGANTALRDAALLCHQLAAAHRGEAELTSLIHDYETRMLDYGFAAVKLSLRNARQAASANRLARGAFKTMLRATNHLPPLKRQFARQIGS